MIWAGTECQWSKKGQTRRTNLRDQQNLKAKTESHFFYLVILYNPDIYHAYALTCLKYFRTGSEDLKKKD